MRLHFQAVANKYDQYKTYTSELQNILLKIKTMIWKIVILAKVILHKRCKTAV